jgi:hypothetical protein
LCGEFIQTLRFAAITSVTMQPIAWRMVFLLLPAHEDVVMAYRSGSFALTPPSIPIFIISLILAIVAFLMRYAGLSIPVIRAQYVFDILAIAYLVMLAGVLLRRL